MRVHVDDRRYFVGNLFADTLIYGDLNCVCLQPEVTIAWHRHQRQTDYLFCAKGTVKVGLTEGPGKSVRWEVLSDRQPRELVIPPNTWHGYRNIGPGLAIIVGFNTQPYDPTDEERMAPAVMGHSWATVEK